MFCNQCGNQLAEGSLFCTRCGAKQIVATPAPEPAPVATPAQDEDYFDRTVSAFHPTPAPQPAAPIPEPVAQPAAPAQDEDYFDRTVSAFHPTPAPAPQPEPEPVPAPAPVAEPPVQQPVYQAPVQQQPVQQPTYQAPVQQPVQQPTYQAPVQQQPVQAPAYHAPVQRPTYQQPMYQQGYQTQSSAYGAPHNGYVGFGKAIGLFFKNYVNFKGRASRSEYWWVYLFNSLISSVLSWIPYIGWLISLALLIPGIALCIRRMHDVGKCWAFALIPIYNLILAFQESDGDNKWGPGPRPMY